MKKIHIKIVVFLIIIVLFDRFLGLFLEHKFYQIDTGTYGNINASLNDNSEIIVLGSSRALHHYNTELMSNKLDKDVYNTGIGGFGIFYNYALLNYKVSNQKNIKAVILDLSPNIIEDSESYNKLNLLLPYYNLDTAFRNIIRLNPDFSVLYRVSKLYQYNSILYDLIRSLLEEENIGFGYKPLNGEIRKDEYSADYLKNKDIDPYKLNYLNRIINICEKNRIELYVLVSPTYEKYDKNNNMIDQIRKFCIKKSVAFFDYSDITELYGKEEFFKDQLHLNKNGADVFTELMIKDFLIIKNLNDGK